MEDRHIVQLYWDRDEQAIPATAEKYGAYCASIAKNILGNHEDAEECVNDTYLHAWNSMPPHSPNRLSIFLGKITRNLSFNCYKRNTAVKRGGGQLPLVLEELAECIPCGRDVEREVEQQELIKALETFLETLSTDKRSIFLRRYWYTESISDIALRFHMKEGAVAMTLSRMRRRLLDFLSERGLEA